MSLYRFKRGETSVKPRRDHQKDMDDRNCCNCGPRGSRPQDFTPATEVNTTKTPTQNNYDRDRNRPAHREDKDPSGTTCYNYNKKAILPTNALKSSS